MQEYKWIFFISLVLIALGVIFSTALEGSARLIGFVFIVLGVLFFFMNKANKKKLEDKEKKE